MAYCAAVCLLLPAQGTTGNKDLGGGRVLVPGQWQQEPLLVWELIWP